MTTRPGTLQAERENVMRSIDIARRISRLEVRERAVEARRASRQRVRDTRRKILIGALVLDRIDSKRDPQFATVLRRWLEQELPGFLIRDGDKTLFPDLMPLLSPPEEKDEGKEER
jgi:hypothetical protein